MEKLVTLLNERKGSKLYYTANWSIRMVWEFPISELEIISKKFWFIQWLVDNNKINFSNIKRIIKDYEVEDNGVLELEDLDFVTKEETLLMLLSISDTPIEDLILYLK